MPIYIHKQHWIIAKSYLEPILGLIQGHNPFSYVKAYENIYYSVFEYLTNMLFNENKLNLNNRFIQIYFSFLRTCAEICFENKFNFGIKKLIDTYMSNPLNRISKSYLEFDKIFAQSLSTGYNITNIQTLLSYLLEEAIRLTVKNQKYDNKYFNSLNDIISNNEKLDEEFNDLIKFVSDSIEFKLISFASFYKINIIFRDIINMCSTYSQFIKRFDKNYNVLENVFVEHVMKSIISTKSKMEFKDFYEIINIPYQKNKIIMYILQGIYCMNNNNMKKYIENGIYVDILNTNILMNSLKYIQSKIKYTLIYPHFHSNL
jgi:hypothetical protein